MALSLEQMAKLIGFPRWTSLSSKNDVKKSDVP